MSHIAFGAARPPNRHRYRFWRSAAAAAVALIAALGGLLGLTASPVHADTGHTTATMSPAQMEAAFYWAVNFERGIRGLAPLGRIDGLQSEARSWSSQLAARNTLYHDRSLMSDIRVALPGAPTAGEAVGMGYSAEQIHAAFMASPAHRALILSPSYHWVGIGIVYGAGGTIWVTERFAG